ncbi:MAG: ASKHA domain-containing protein [Armatimonadota bacterium]
MSQKLVNVTFLPSGKVTQVESGESLRNIIGSSDTDLRMQCGGKGSCGKCKVIFQSGVPEVNTADEKVLNEMELAQGYRLACQATISEDSVIFVPNGDGMKSSKVLTVGTARKVNITPVISKKHAVIPKPSVTDLRSDLTRVLDALEINADTTEFPLTFLRMVSGVLRASDFNVTCVFADGIPIAFEPGDTTSERYGVAFDIGTTTIAGYLMELNTGNQISVASAMNPQSRVGDDVISRISYVMSDSDGLEALRSSVLNELNGILTALLDGTGISRDRVYEAVIVGNTCMTHLFMGIDPRHLAMSPYVPAVSQSLYLDAREIGLDINQYGKILVLPCIAGYVGADTVGVILASDIYESDKLTLAVDIGTNGEIVLGSKDRLVACSTAAGPAFEGAHIKHGMRAAPGAIDSVWMDDNNLYFTTVGNKPATGICGSGLLDVIIFMLKAGIIEDGGRIVDVDEIPEEFANLRTRLVDGERGNDFILATVDQTSIGEPIKITQRDVREVQLAKSAIAAGILTLMEELSVDTNDLDRVILAGAFGNYVRKESAIAAGMLPNVPLSKVHSVGNAAGEGAKLALISSDIRRDADKIGSHVHYIELTTNMGFQDKFADALIFAEMS